MQPSVLYILHLAMSLSGSHVTTATTTTTGATTTWLRPTVRNLTPRSWDIHINCQQINYSPSDSVSLGVCLLSFLVSHLLFICVQTVQGQEEKKSLNISRTSCALIDICSNTHKSVPARETKWIWNECAGEGAGTVSAKCSHTSKASLCAKIFSEFEQIFCPSVRTWKISANKAFAICKRHTN